MTLLAAVLAVQAGCGGPPPEEALRATVERMHVAIEARDAGRLMAPVSEDFVGADGLDRPGLERLARLQFLRNAGIGATLGPLDVRLVGERATVAFTVALTGGAGLLPERGNVYAVETGWRLEGGEWRLISAEWQPKL